MGACLRTTCSSTAVPTRMRYAGDGGSGTKLAGTSSGEPTGALLGIHTALSRRLLTQGDALPAGRKLPALWQPPPPPPGGDQGGCFSLMLSSLSSIPHARSDLLGGAYSARSNLSGWRCTRVLGLATVHRQVSSWRASLAQKAPTGGPECGCRSSPLPLQPQAGGGKQCPAAQPTERACLPPCAVSRLSPRAGLPHTAFAATTAL